MIYIEIDMNYIEMNMYLLYQKIKNFFFKFSFLIF